MRLLYLASIRLPTEKAHGIQIMKTCEAFAESGIETMLRVPEFLNSPSTQDPFAYYGVKKVFNIRRSFGVRLLQLGQIGFFLETLIFFIIVIFSGDFWLADYIFSRDEFIIFLSGMLGKKTIWETHTGSYNIFARASLNKSKLVVSISQGLKDFYISKGVPESKVIVSPDGVDLKDFEISYSKGDVRSISGLPLGKKIVLYAGRLDGWKGVETFFEASKYFNDDIIAVALGGDTNQINSFSKKYPNVHFLGYKPYKELPVYQKSADVLVIPNISKSDISRLYTSPLKVFSYMASGVPIVASDLPSIREVLSEANSVLVKPDDPQALLDGINGILEDKNMADIISKQALIDVIKYSWTERVRSIISTIS